METFLIVRYLHFLGILLVVSALFYESVVVGKELQPREWKALARIDGLYGFGAILTTAMGLWMWLGEIGKPAEFYSSNWIFLTKFGLFILVGLLSIYPTVMILKMSKKKQSGRLSNFARVLVYLELAIVFLIPFMAVLMARGVGT